MTQQFHSCGASEKKTHIRTKDNLMRISTIQIARLWEPPQCPSRRPINKWGTLPQVVGTSYIRENGDQSCKD